MTAARVTVKAAIAIFCVWHMAGVFLYSFYPVEGHPRLEWIENYREYTRPYILMTSQWQRWNLFSPDPLRRVIAFDFEKRAGEDWERFALVDEHSVNLFHRSAELKTLRRMEEPEFKPLQERYTHDVCKRYNVEPGTEVRLTKRWFVIPKNEKTQSKEWWDAWEPEWQETVLVITTCPDKSIKGQVLRTKGILEPISLNTNP